MNSPFVSVIMSVYNGEPHLSQSIPSILGQTFTDFELILIDDGSTDDTLSLLHWYEKQDKRIRVFFHENKGLARSLNVGCRNAAGELLARQDADDISLPSRLKTQVGWFETNPKLVLLGASSLEQRKGNRRAYRHCRSFRQTRELLHRWNPIIHSSAMFRKNAFDLVGGYREELRTCQDYDLWMRLSNLGDIGITPEMLVIRKTMDQSISRKRRFRQCSDAFRIRMRYRKHLASPGIWIIVLWGIYQFVTAYMPFAVIRAKRNLFNRYVGEKQ